MQADRFPECIMCELYGDETPDTRKMMMRLQVCDCFIVISRCLVL